MLPPGKKSHNNTIYNHNYKYTMSQSQTQIMSHNYKFSHKSHISSSRMLFVAHKLSILLITIAYFILLITII